MALPLHQADTARKVSLHECGHWVVARVLGFRTGPITLQLTGPINGHRGGAALEPARPLRPDDVQDYLERRIKVLYAGAAAETLKMHLPGSGVDREDAHAIIESATRGAAQDAAKARELVHLLRNLRHPETEASDNDVVQPQLAAIAAELWAGSIELVEKHEKIICGLAGNLMARVKEVGPTYAMEADYLDGLQGVIDLDALVKADAT